MCMWHYRNTSAISLKVAACHWHFKKVLIYLPCRSAKLLLPYLLRTLSIFVQTCPNQTFQLGAQILDLDSRVFEHLETWSLQVGHWIPHWRTCPPDSSSPITWGQPHPNRSQKRQRLSSRSSAVPVSVELPAVTCLMRQEPDADFEARTRPWKFKGFESMCGYVWYLKRGWVLEKKSVI